MSNTVENLTPSEKKALAASAIQNARLSLQLGDRRQARRYAEQAAKLAPETEDPWLLLAALASPRASVTYLQRALNVNPASQRARKGMQWALERLKTAETEPELAPVPVVPPSTAAPTAEIGYQPIAEPAGLIPSSSPPASQKEPALSTRAGPLPPGRAGIGPRTAVRVRIPSQRKRPRAMPPVMVYAFSLLCLSVTLFAASLTPYYLRLWDQYSAGLFSQSPLLRSLALYLTGYTQPSLYVAGIITATSEAPKPEEVSGMEPTPSEIQVSPTFTLPPIDTATLVPTQTASFTIAPSETPAPTSTPTELPTETPTAIPPTPIQPTLEPPTPVPPTPAPAVQPTKKAKKKNLAAPEPRPANIQLTDHWIDVDLSSQTVFAMQGDQVVRSFIVSTGRWPTVTVTGTFRIYVKYRSADMSGPDYYLPDVPYVMYFYKGYGLHGTYWHNNFGTPMSHGCINLRTSDAAWLFEFASVGTVVNVHQ